MKKLFVLLAILSLTALNAFATPQLTDDADVQVSATVVHSPLEITGDEDNHDLGDYTRGYNGPLNTGVDGSLYWDITGTASWVLGTYTITGMDAVSNGMTLQYSDATSGGFSIDANGDAQITFNITGIQVVSTSAAVIGSDGNWTINCAVAYN